MTNELIHITANMFRFGEGCIRAALRDGEAIFIASDVASTLGYVDPSQAVRMHCKAAEKLSHVEL